MLASSKIALLLSPLTSYAKTYLPFTSTTPYFQIASLILLLCHIIFLARIAASCVKMDFFGSFKRIVLAANSR